jgi:hypothetical protein
MIILHYTNNMAGGWAALIGLGINDHIVHYTRRL